MKEIKLSQAGKNKILNLVALVDDEDFEYLNQFNWHAAYYKNTRSYYARRNEYTEAGELKIYMSRLIMGVTDSNVQVDHKDHNTLNNTKDNLRISTIPQNCANRKPCINTSSKYKGVTWYKNNNKWLAQIGKGEKRKHLGYFVNEEDAARAYNDAARKLYGEFAYLNEVAA